LEVRVKLKTLNKRFLGGNPIFCIAFFQKKEKNKRKKTKEKKQKKVG